MVRLKCWQRAGGAAGASAGVQRNAGNEEICRWLGRLSEFVDLEFAARSRQCQFRDGANLSKGEKVMKNEDAEVVSITVAEVIERSISELAKTKRRIDELEVIVGEQQAALRDAVTTIKALIEGKKNWPRASAAKALSN
jgi:hypothetical protein